MTPRPLFRHLLIAFAITAVFVNFMDWKFPSVPMTTGEASIVFTICLLLIATVECVMNVRSVIRRASK